MTTGSLAGTDTGAFTQTFDTKNVGIDKTLTPAGTVSDGNGGANYAITSRQHDRCDHRPRRHRHGVDRHQDLRLDDELERGPDAITSGTLRRRHGSFTQTFDTKNVGAKTLPAGSITDGTRRQLHDHLRQRHHRYHRAPITVTATTDTKTYDGTTSSSAIPTITAGTLAGH